MKRTGILLYREILSRAKFYSCRKKITLIYDKYARENTYYEEGEERWDMLQMIEIDRLYRS